LCDAKVEVFFNRANLRVAFFWIIPFSYGFTLGKIIEELKTNE
jgi:hypothetical protein